MNGDLQAAERAIDQFTGVIPIGFRNAILMAIRAYHGAVPAPDPIGLNDWVINDRKRHHGDLHKFCTDCIRDGCRHATDQEKYRKGAIVRYADGFTEIITALGMDMDDLGQTTMVVPCKAETWVHLNARAEDLQLIKAAPQ